jgi:hypothetical protein
MNLVVSNSFNIVARLLVLRETVAVLARARVTVERATQKRSASRRVWVKQSEK